MAIYLAGYNTLTPNETGGVYARTLHLHPGCDGPGCDAPDALAFNHLDEVHAALRMIRTGFNTEKFSATGAYTRNRVLLFRVWGDTPSAEYTRQDVDALPVGRLAPDHPVYPEHRQAHIDGAPARGESAAVTDAAMVSPEQARALGFKGVHLWAPLAERKPIEPTPERIDDTTVEMLVSGSDNPRPQPVYVRTLPDRYQVHGNRTVMDVFGHEGRWFTVPGNFPARLPDFLSRQSRELFAVYQDPNIVAGALVWVMRAAVPGGRILGTSTESRYLAVRQGLAALANYRVELAETIQGNRAAAGLELIKPVRIAYGDTAQGPGWILHVRCACVIEPRDAVGDSDTVSGAAELFADTDDPWALCARSPRVLRNGDGRPVGQIEERWEREGEGGKEGRPVFFALAMDGSYGYGVRLDALAAYEL